MLTWDSEVHPNDQTALTTILVIMKVILFSKYWTDMYIYHTFVSKGSRNSEQRPGGTTVWLRATSGEKSEWTRSFSQ